MHSQVKAIARTFTIGGGPRVVRSRVASALRSQNLIDYIEDESHILNIAVYDTQGRYLSAGISLQEPTIQEYFRQSYIEALQNDSWMSPPYVVGDPLFYTVVVVSAPILASAGDDIKTVVGVISAMVSLEPVQQMVESRKLGGRDVYVVDGRGFLIAHSDREILFNRPDYSRTIMVQAFREARGRASGSVNFKETLDGRTRAMVGTYTSIGDRGSRIPFLNSLDWGAVVQAEEEAVYSSVREMERTSYSVAVVFALLGVSIAIAFAGRLSRPIAHLAEGARRLAAGDFSQNIDVQSRNEIGELAETFNLMQAEIRGYIGRLKQLFEQTIRTLAQAIDAKDPYTRGHSDRVSQYSEAIARIMGVPEQQCEIIRIGALMHDIGKIGIEDKILGKAGPLTEEEFEIMKSHPVKGAAILKPVGMLKDMIPAMKHHHENLDGTGYPDGLSGEGIPLTAKIVAVADTFDAMTTTRPYQKAMEITYVFERMRSFVGKKFDEEIVEALITAYEEGRIRPNMASQSPPKAKPSPAKPPKAQVPPLGRRVARRVAGGGS
jgi:putative nucleotidyltransferase with HDIG domain